MSSNFKTMTMESIKPLKENPCSSNLSNSPTHLASVSHDIKEVQ